MDDLAAVRRYHEVTKHDLSAYARGPGFLDWATQPDPFRRYAGAEVLPLMHDPPRPGDGGPEFGMPFTEGRVAPAPVDLSAMSRLMYDSLSLSAWKEAGGNRWALRVNPSSGNLHPTEGYVACGPVPDLTDTPMVAHYAPAAHALEVRRRPPIETWGRVTAELPPDTFLVGLTSIHWREAWKYGERAFRYCQHDAGHALAAVSLAASAMGWRTRMLADLGDDELAALLGLAAGDREGAEPEHPDMVLAISPGPAPTATRLPADGVAEIGAGPWTGTPNRLSPAHVAWEAVDAVTAATAKPPTEGAFEPSAPPSDPPGVREDGTASFRTVVRRRRSAVAMDGVTGTDAATFFRILARTMPGPGRVPFAALPWPPAIHLGLFVHRVAGLTPGLYLLARDARQVDFLRTAMTEPAFLWRPVPGAPPELLLCQLIEEDVRRLAGVVSCHQQIASHGAFALGMLAAFDGPLGPLGRLGPWSYRHLFWEAGAVGQVLYLEAEAAGLGATGIGCYFDDPVHRAFGIDGTALQSLYHFTVGGGVADPRLKTLPAYADAAGGPP